MSIGPADFPIGSTLVTFTGLDGAEVDGLNIGDLTFNYSLGTGLLTVGNGPGITNNITAPAVISTGDPSGVLTITLSSFRDAFGFGFALLDTTVVPDATMIKLFSGDENVGSLSYNGKPDPDLTGGFAGIHSTVPFNSVQIIFNSAEAPAFALDNIHVSQTAVPEPCSGLLLLSGASLIWTRRCRPVGRQ